MTSRRSSTGDESTLLAVHEHAPIQSVVGTTDPMVIFANAVERGTPPEQLAQIMDLVERVQKNKAAEAFALALAKFQADCPIIVKKRGVTLERNSATPSYYYASLDDIMRQIAPILADCGLSISFSASLTEAGHLSATCSVRCGSHVQDSTITLPVPAEMRVNATQKMGAAMSYAKRYALCAALNITVGGEDTDGKGLDAKPVSSEQMKEINDLIASTGADLPRFLKWIGVDSVSELTVKQFNIGVAELRRKKAKADQ